MRLGALVPISPANADPDFVGRLGALLEDRGVESLWVPDHVIHLDRYDSPYPYTADGKLPLGVDVARLDPLTVLTFVAATTRNLRLGTGVCIAAQRQPVYLAKQLADLDALSGGRLEFGVGVGWAREEFEALGVSFSDRGARTTEYLRLLKTLWTNEVASFDGAFVTLPPSRLDPKPVQQPHPPIVVGGDSDGALRRVAEVGDGWYAYNRSPDELEAALRRLARAIDAADRALSSIAVTVCPPADYLTAAALDAYAGLGVHRIIVRLPARDLGHLEQLLDGVDLNALRERVAV